MIHDLQGVCIILNVNLFYWLMKGLAITDLCQTEVPRLPDLRICDESILCKISTNFSEILQRIQRSKISSAKADLFVDRVRDQIVQSQFLLWSWVRSSNCKESEVKFEVKSFRIHVQQRSIINSFNYTLFILFKFGSVKDQKSISLKFEIGRLR